MASYRTIYFVLYCSLQRFENRVSSYLLVIMRIGVLACLGFQYLSILLFYFFFNFFVVSSLSSNLLLVIILWKRCFVKYENQSLFDRKLTGLHQRIKSKEKIMIIIKRGLRKIPEVRVPEDQFISPLISWSFCFTFRLFHNSVWDNQMEKVCRWSRIHSFLQKY